MRSSAPAQQDARSPGSPSQGEAVDTTLLRLSDNPDRFTGTDGEALYRTICQACHMEDEKGAAGAHPLLAGNPKLISKHFLSGVILTGYYGMPRFGHQMSDEQIAAVANYVRSHFGNDYPDPGTPDQASRLRPQENGD